MSVIPYTVQDLDSHTKLVSWVDIPLSVTTTPTYLQPFPAYNMTKMSGTIYSPLFPYTCPDGTVLQVGVGEMPDTQVTWFGSNQPTAPVAPAQGISGVVGRWMTPYISSVPTTVEVYEPSNGYQTNITLTSTTTFAYHVLFKSND